MSASVELVKASYIGKVATSDRLGDVLGIFRNTAVDLIESCDIAKYNFMNYASGNLNHPVQYEW